MTCPLPFHNTVRAFVPRSSAGHSAWACIADRSYAQNPQHYVRAYLLIQNDLVKLFEYVEPSDKSAPAYSYRIHELLMRTCIEVEANCRAILDANGYIPVVNDWGKPVLNMSVYRKIEKSHHMSSYEVLLPIWNGDKRLFKPFAPWAGEGKLPWYETYHAAKHDRLEAFMDADLETLVTAIAGLLALLTAQYRDHDFTAGATGLSVTGYDYHELEPAIGSLFRIKYPDDWSQDELYDFDWSVLEKQEDRFAKFDYNAI